MAQRPAQPGDRRDRRDRLWLTLGIHSRIDATVRHILSPLKVGNSYISRSMIGPSSACSRSAARLSPAPAPRYLHRFATERTISTDTTAAGGNATLLSLQDETEVATW